MSIRRVWRVKKGRRFDEVLYKVQIGLSLVEMEMAKCVRRFTMKQREEREGFQNNNKQNKQRGGRPRARLQHGKKVITSTQRPLDHSVTSLPQPKPVQFVGPNLKSVR